MTALTFKSDTKHRKQYFTGLHFSHPAKMHLSLQLWLIDNYTKPGEVILDPMAGSGTILVACMMGRHVVTVELEDKFVSMQSGNWEKIRQRGPMLGYEMGQFIILQGDARDMRGILADSIITSPPYEGTESRDRSKESWWDDEREKKYSGGSAKIAKGYQAAAADAIISSPPYEGSDVSQTHMTSNDRGNPANPNYRPSWKTKLEQGYAETKRPYADKIITSPPYAEQERDRKDTEKELSGGIFKNRSYRPGDAYSSSDNNLGNLPYGSIDKVITSPPYEGTNTTGQPDTYNGSHGPHSQVQLSDYRESQDNIGNLKGDTYLEAMLLVYQNCHAVLKQDGLLILVTKNFIRDQKEIRLDEDTIKLCGQAGFAFKERHYRKLTSQSFWRTIYQQKYPDAPVLFKEDILIFSKGLLA